MELGHGLQEFVEKAQAGDPLPNFVRGSLAEDFVKTSPYGTAVGDAAKAQADTIKADMMKGGFIVFKGPLNDNQGNQVVAAGQNFGETATELEETGYLIEA